MCADVHRRRGDLRRGQRLLEREQIGLNGSGGSGATDGGSGTGGAGACPAGQVLCGSECSTLNKDPYNCGECGNACAPAQVCSSGSCALACASTESECGGACVTTDNDPEHCGGCGVACGAGEVCSNGQCAVVCQAGLSDCNGSCVNTQTDDANCGACGAACPLGTVCTSATCVVTCQPGLVVCNGKCTNSQTDNANCGSCGTVCPSGKACSGGSCVTQCGAAQTDCSGTCVNLETDNANCGGCGIACGPGLFCVQGQCTLECASPLELCGAACTNTQTDPANCGTCNTICPTGQVCIAGACQGTTCTPGATELCYTGPANTLGVGPCKPGMKTCNAQGTGYGTCAGEVVPQAEICGDGFDQDCSGADNAISVAFSEDFSDNSAGWTLGTDWQIGSATASACTSTSTGNDPATDHSPSTDNGVAGVLIGGCYPTTLHGDYCLESPVIDISGLANPYLSYWRHLHTDYPNYVHSKIEVSSNGGTSWTSIFSVPASTFVNDAQWTNFQYALSAHKSAQFRVRWCYSTGPSTGIIAGGGWNIDDVQITDGQCI